MGNPSWVLHMEALLLIILATYSLAARKESLYSLRVVKLFDHIGVMITQIYMIWKFARRMVKNIFMVLETQMLRE